MEGRRNQKWRPLKRLWNHCDDIDCLLSGLNISYEMVCVSVYETRYDLKTVLDAYKKMWCCSCPSFKGKNEHLFQKWDWVYDFCLGQMAWSLLIHFNKKNAADAGYIAWSLLKGKLSAQSPVFRCYPFEKIIVLKWSLLHLIWIFKIGF